jgi:hypothetical protein
MPRQGDTAFMLQGQWQRPSYGLEVGHNDLGVYYTSLSAQALPGVRETYGRANWLATSWLSFNGDVRRTLNRRVTVALPAVAPAGFPVAPTPVPEPVPLLSTSATETDSWALGANVSVLPVNGLSLGLQRSQSDTESGFGPSRNDTTSASLSWAREGWQAGLSYMLLETESGTGFFLNGSETRTLNYSVGKSWSDSVVQTWRYGVNATLSDQKTTFLAGNQTTNVAIGLGLNGEHPRWGSANGSFMFGRMRDPLSALRYDTRGARVEWGLRFWQSGFVKLFAARNELASDNGLIGYKDRTFGLQLAYQNW